MKSLLFLLLASSIVRYLQVGDSLSSAQADRINVLEGEVVLTDNLGEHYTKRSQVRGLKYDDSGLNPVAQLRKLRKADIGDYIVLIANMDVSGFALPMKEIPRINISDPRQFCLIARKKKNVSKEMQQGLDDIECCMCTIVNGAQQCIPVPNAYVSLMGITGGTILVASGHVYLYEVPLGVRKITQGSHNLTRDGSLVLPRWDGVPSKGTIRYTAKAGDMSEDDIRQIVVDGTDESLMPVVSRGLSSIALTTQPVRQPKMISGVGWRTLPSIGKHYHTGHDYIGASSDVFAVAPGRVVADTNIGDGWGGRLLIQGEDGNVYLYAHITPLKKKGDVVQSGEKIGVYGSSGISTGAHLHLEIRKGQAKTMSDIYGFPIVTIDQSARGAELGYSTVILSGTVLHPTMPGSWGKVEWVADVEGKIVDIINDRVLVRTKSKVGNYHHYMLSAPLHDNVMLKQGLRKESIVPANATIGYSKDTRTPSMIIVPWSDELRITDISSFLRAWDMINGGYSTTFATSSGNKSSVRGDLWPPHLRTWEVTFVRIWVLLSLIAVVIVIIKALK
jgi:murein DD-endopeptidase MepM/ murein hydrolase activator NlpD